MAGLMHFWPSRHDLAVCAWRAGGIAMAILAMELSAETGGVPLGHVPFVTSIVLVLSFPESEAAQPRSIIAGHLLSSLAGWLVSVLVGQGDLQAAAAVAIAGFAMLLARSPHPPAGLDAFLIVHNGLPLNWIASPVLIGAGLLSAFGRLLFAGERALFKSRP